MEKSKNEPTHEKRGFSVVCFGILQTRSLRSYSKESVTQRCGSLSDDFSSSLYCVNEGSGDNTWMRRLAGVFAFRLCDKYLFPHELAQILHVHVFLPASR